MPERQSLKRAAWGGLVPAALAAVLAVPAAAEAPRLVTPVACTLGEDCFVQNLVDVDPGPEATDFRCTSFTYDGHSGTDFRVPNRVAMERGVAVLSAAPGRVLRVRDGEPDRDFGADQGADVSGRECGNGVVVAHAGGLETQYCHLREGSLAVRPGERVAAGTPLGLVGASGETEFHHVHVTVRRDGETVDPFTGRAVGEGACGEPGEPLWADAAPVTAAIEARVVNAGFAAGPVDMADIEAGRLPIATLAPDAPALVFFGRAANLRAGDEQRIAITGPAGLDLATTAEPLPDRRAQAMVFAGRRAPDGGWPQGIYAGRYEVIRDGAVLDAAAVTLVVGE